MSCLHHQGKAAWVSVFILFIGITYSEKAQAYLSVPSSPFVVSADLKQRVEFWEHIFTRYGDEVIVLHDRKRPWITIDFLFFDQLAEIRGDDRFLKREEQSRIMDLYYERYEKALQRLSEKKKGALRYGKAERRLFKAYQGSRLLLRELYNGSVKVRMQRGLAHSFMQAAHTAQDYLPYFEKEFRQMKVPVEVARLAFVESMFNPHAISKVGASGMWQFMKATARSFMRVGREIDERHSPFKAARAAARMLREDYKALGSWPLAITAYNHGRGGMKRAVLQTGSHDINTIIENYESSTFGFASQNFYAEFLAAHRSYERLIHSQKINIRPSRLDITAVKLSRPTRIKDLSRVLGVQRDVLAALNLCIKPRTFKYHLSYVLPKNYRLYVPRRIVETSLKNSPPTSLAFYVP